MVEVTRLDKKVYWVNPHQIECIEENPDTTLIMLSGKRLVISETITQLKDRIIEYRKRIGGFKNED